MLADDGTFWLNVGDGYARNGGNRQLWSQCTGRQHEETDSKTQLYGTRLLGTERPRSDGVAVASGVCAASGWVVAAFEDHLGKESTYARERQKSSLKRDRGGFPVLEDSNYYYDNQAVREETGANLKNYWLLGPDSSSTPHPAAFPKELARRCILLGSRPGDLVLDPFSGSGTTGLVAAELNRKAVLIELNEEYVSHSKTRFNAVAQQAFPI